MACCLFLLRLLAPLSRRLGLDASATRPPRLPVVPIAVLGLLEVLTAFYLVRRVEDDPVGAHAHHVIGAHANHDAVAGSASALTLGSAGAIVLTLVIAALGIRAAGRTRIPVALVGAAVIVAAAILAAGHAAASSHALMMLVIEAALVVGPVAIVGFAADPRPADDVWVVVRCALAATTAALAMFLLITLHLPGTHGWYLGRDALEWWLVPLLAASGLGFWSSLLRFRLPATWRALLLVAVLETGAVIGLVLLVAGDALMSTSGGAGLGVLADQRLAGGVMMLVDLALLARVVEPVLRPARRREVGRVPAPR